MGTFSVWHWLIVLLVVVLVFGSKKLVNVGPDLGKAFRGFQKSMREGADSAGDAGENSAALESRDAASSPAESAAAGKTAEKSASSS